MKILVSDDQVDVLEAIRLLLKGAGHHTETADSPRAALALAEQSSFDLVLMDMNYSRDTTSGDEGLALLDQLLARNGGVPVIVMTAWSSVDLAVEAMRRGAVDFIQKPWDNARLLATIEKQATRSKERKKARSELEIARHVQQRLLLQHLLAAQNDSLQGDDACPRGKSAATTTIFWTSAPAAWVCCSPTCREKASQPRCSPRTCRHPSAASSNSA